MTRRLPPAKETGGLLNLRIFKSAPFALYTASAFLAFLGIYTGNLIDLKCEVTLGFNVFLVLTYIIVSASESGVDGSFAFYLLSIANASSIIGRLSAGFLTDHIGKQVTINKMMTALMSDFKQGAINAMSPFSLAAAVLTYVWPFVHGKSAYVAIAIFYGRVIQNESRCGVLHQLIIDPQSISSGVYVSQIGVPIIAFGNTSDVGRRTGAYLTVLALGALAGPPISGAINQATGEFRAVGAYAGTVIVASVVAMWAAKCALLRHFWGKF